MNPSIRIMMALELGDSSGEARETHRSLFPHRAPDRGAAGRWQSAWEAPTPAPGPTQENSRATSIVSRNVSAAGARKGEHAAKQPRHRCTGCPTVTIRLGAGRRKGMCMTRKEIEKQIAALKKEALEYDYNKGDPHKWRETIDNIWQDIERLEFILQCAPNKATN
jgi:hypothetical protein